MSIPRLNLHWSNIQENNTKAATQPHDWLLNTQMLGNILTTEWTVCFTTRHRLGEKIVLPLQCVVDVPVLKDERVLHLSLRQAWALGRMVALEAALWISLAKYTWWQMSAGVPQEKFRLHPSLLEQVIHTRSVCLHHPAILWWGCQQVR